MLLEFSCQNHKSIRQKILFSAVAGTDTTFIDRTIEFESNNILKTIVIYGANGSGKSSFVDAISFVKSLITNSINHQPGQGILQNPHKLDGANVDSIYNIQFVIGNIRYAYGFTLNNYLVKEEYLYYFPNGRQAKIFERMNITFETGSKFKGKLSMCKDVLKPNRLLLSCAANFSSIPEIEAVYKYFLDDIVIYGLESQKNWMNYSIHTMHDNFDIKKDILSFMNALGIAVKDIKIKIDQQQLGSENIDLPDFLSDEFKTQLLQSTVDAISAKTVYENFEVDLINEESTGIQKLFSFLCPFLDIIVNNKVLICDELEQSLHESILKEIIELFIKYKPQSNAQLFFTTHNTSLLSLELFRRDQIWFTELTGCDRSTSLYSLVEIKNVRKDENISKGYISGKYGAIPMLNVNFANNIEDL